MAEFEKCRRRTLGGAVMRYASVCDGISAVSVAWRPLGWTCSWVSEIDPFACAVIAHRFPDHHNLGDMLAITKETLAHEPEIDLLVGGTPCQSFSVAGLRKGMDDPRGNLSLRFVQLADVLGPRWVLWENVPGVLSSGSGRDFGAILGALAELGYGWAYRILDAQHFGVPQRRRRVFVVGYRGDWRRAAAVLFDAHCLGGHPAPGPKAEEVDSSHAAGRAGTVSAKWAKGRGGPSGDECQNLIAYRTAGDGGVYHEGDRSAPLTTNTDPSANILVAGTLTASAGRRRGNGIDPQCLVSGTLQSSDGKRGRAAVDPGHLIVSPTLQASGRARSGGEPDQVIPVYQCHGSSVGPVGTLRRAHNEGSGVPFLPVAIGARFRGDDGRGYGRPEHVSEGVAGTVDATKPERVCLGPDYGVRRFTPMECERLQGFPDQYTLVPFRGKPASDTARYKGIGNSMAVDVMRWIGRRMEWIDLNCEVR